jgi:hypothetical protein
MSDRLMDLVIGLKGVFKIESSSHTRAFRSKIKCPNKNGTINYTYHNTRYVRDSNTSVCSSGNFAKQAKGPLSFPILMKAQ